ncbi:MAG: hypothetical protein WAQ28_16875 [Bacteroidia bacterium]|jgi:hypothetical protein
MAPLQLRNLCLNSLLLLLLFTACSPTQGYKLSKREVVSSAQVKSIINADSSRLYKAGISLYSKYYSGLILLKQTDATTSHLVFVTELGMKMFDFQIRDNEMKLIYVFEPLNKPELLNLLENDMKLICLQHLLNKEVDVYEKAGENSRIYKLQNKKQRHFYVTDAPSRTVSRVLVKGSMRVKENVEYSYDSNGNASHIKLKHKGFIRLKIELTAITKKV